MKKYVPLILSWCLVLLFAAPTAAEPADAVPLPSLKAFYADYFDFGSALSGAELANVEFTPFYNAQYAIITPENELKPENVLDLAECQILAQEDQGGVAVNFNAAKPILDFAMENGLKVHGHVLFWHSQTPDEFFHESYSISEPYVTRDVMLRRMENYVRLTMDYLAEHYPGVVVSWDVVNEAIDDSNGKLRQSRWTDIVGDDFVLHAFRFARQYAPESTLLFYNDYSTPYMPKLSGILSLLEELNAEGLVDGHGLQCHYQLNTPSTTQITMALQKIIALGLMVRISEWDILLDSDTEASFQLQATRYQAMMKIFIKYAEHIVAVQTWGTRDSLSWKSSHYPLLFTGDGSPKPAFYALVNPEILP